MIMGTGMEKVMVMGIRKAMVIRMEINLVMGMEVIKRVILKFSRMHMKAK